MATLDAQRKWRQKNRIVKSQLNIIARRKVHEYLDEIATSHDLRGKAEAVTFSVYAMMALLQQGSFNKEAERLHRLFTEAYHRDRDMFQP
jgi:hypothetical protein